LNFKELNETNKYFRKYNNEVMDLFFLKFKDNRLLIYLELYKNKILINRYNHKYFLKKNNIKLYLYKNFVFKIEVIMFLIYRDYIEFIKRYKYNEYLDENIFIYKYPLLKILLRKVDQVLLDILKKKEKNFVKREDILKNYNLYYININKKKKYLLNINDLKYIHIFFKNQEMLKLLILTLKSKLIKKNRYFTKLLKKNILLYIF
jgi:hypothetical protein